MKEGVFWSREWGKTPRSCGGERGGEGEWQGRGAREFTNELWSQTAPFLDPVAKIPETKVAAVRLEKIG
jgi:hypothetical protein